MKCLWNEIVELSSIPCSEGEIGSFEEMIGYRLPDDYKQFLLAVNGGKVKFQSAITLPEFRCEIQVDSFHSLLISEDVGLRRERFCQKGCRIELGRVMLIGDADEGGGLLYLVLGGSEKGCVYYSYIDERSAFGDENTWNSIDSPLPDTLMFVCHNFDSLGKLILKGKGKVPWPDD